MIRYFIAVAFLVHFDLSLWWWIAFAVVTIIDIGFTIAEDDRFKNMRERQYEANRGIEGLRHDLEAMEERVNGNVADGSHRTSRQHKTHNKIDALRDDVREIKSRVNDINNGVDEIMNDITSISSRI